MTDQQELAIARIVLRSVEQWARAYSKSCDESAATVAILARAFELATPELSPQARGNLFQEEE